ASSSCIGPVSFSFSFCSTTAVDVDEWDGVCAECAGRGGVCTGTDGACTGLAGTLVGFGGSSLCFHVSLTSVCARTRLTEKRHSCRDSLQREAEHNGPQGDARRFPRVYFVTGDAFA